MCEHLYDDSSQSLPAELFSGAPAAPEFLCSNNSMPQRNETPPGCMPPDNGLRGHHAAAVGSVPAYNPTYGEASAFSCFLLPTYQQAATKIEYLQGLLTSEMKFAVIPDSHSTTTPVSVRSV